MVISPIIYKAPRSRPLPRRIPAPGSQVCRFQNGRLISTVPHQIPPSPAPRAVPTPTEVGAPPAPGLSPDLSSVALAKEEAPREGGSPPIAPPRFPSPSWSELPVHIMANFSKDTFYNSGHEPPFALRSRGSLARCARRSAIELPFAHRLTGSGSVLVDCAARGRGAVSLSSFTQGPPGRSQEPAPGHCLYPSTILLKFILT